MGSLRDGALQPRPASGTVWALPVSLATTHGIDYFFIFLRLLRCFTSPGLTQHPCGWTALRPGLPHSEIFGSKRNCHSPKLIATFCVLHRLLVPRYSSCALLSYSLYFYIAQVCSPARKPADLKFDVCRYQRTIVKWA